MPKQYPTPAVRRLQVPPIPRIDVGEAANKVLPGLPQIPEFGFHNCIPKDAGRRLKEHLNGTPKYDLLQHVAHAKRWIREKITAYLDGALPYWIRKVKYIIDKIKIIQYAARTVATARFIQSLLEKEVELANHYCNESIALIDYAKSTLTPAGLRTQAEEEMARVWEIQKADLISQIAQNNASLECLI